MSEPVVYTLKYAVELRNKDGDVIETVRELTLKRLSGGQTRRVLNAQSKGNGEFTFALICESAGIPPSTFDKLDGEDVIAMANIAAPFLASGPATP